MMEFCPYCDGSGESAALSGGGPDAYDVLITCPRCRGAQTLQAAYETLAEELPALQLKVAQLGIFHSHATRYGWAPNQTTGMQSFRELATQWLYATPGPRGENAGVVVEAWQSIETAPKDGTGMLALWVHEGDSVTARNYALVEFVRGCWRDTESDDQVYTEPTYWQHLPPAPDRGLRIAEKGDDRG